MNYIIIATYILLYIFVLSAILIKIKQKSKVHAVWYIVLVVLTITPVILGVFQADSPTFRETVSIP